MNDTDLPAPTGTPYAEGGPISPGRPYVNEGPQEQVIPAIGWYTVPGFVRVAVWLWALVTVLGFAAGLVFSLVWAIILMLTLGAQ